ncbi:MAG: 4Fe-4S dicluster domain-containing protein [Methanothrix sp.]|nr:4Fe-4S dicluster domain-containing protein [Methanothrix sp.]
MQMARESMPRDRSCHQIREAIKRADWETLGRECLGCGGCTFVCPVCHCFNILDRGIPDGERLRCRTPGQRLRHWYQDKFEDIPKITGLPGCVGCGRCRLACPASINRADLSVQRWETKR